MSNKKCIIITGPTASGKTSVAVDLAQRYSTRIISADSRQCFIELNAGVAKPSSAQLQQVRHYFINTHSVTDVVTAATFEAYALNKVHEIFKDNDVAIMVGGTGLYIDAFCWGFDPLPETDPAIRSSIQASYQQEGFSWLSSAIEQHDPLFFTNGEIRNPQRMMRALEIKLATGKSILEFHAGKKKVRDFDIVKTGLELPREELRLRIDKRVDRMIEEGLAEEAKTLYPLRHLNALKTVGYQELFDYFDEKISFPDAIDRIKINTRRYAKRQMTWFKKDPDIVWQHPDQLQSI